ncbi:glycosyltransferase family 2 protein [Enorma massiliensis]|uniref:glycosyltransferase family 2 protein n=1 Tax=Enorma massiliensis TaxID=1472761 RepID=UPI00320B55CA
MYCKPNGISIVIATKGRVTLLDELLASLDIARKRFSGPSEVVLVDDSSPEDVVLVDESCARHNARRIAFGPSVSEKRNVGVKNSIYDIVLLLDSDCLATPNLLVEHYDAYSDETVGAVAGLLEFTGPDTWFWLAVAHSQFVVCFDFPRWMPEVPWTPTANCSVRRDLFLELGGFDAGFPNKPGGEDVDLGLRLTSSGHSMVCRPEALVYHQKKTWVSVKAMIKRLWHYGSADYYLMERHPDLLWRCYPRRTLMFTALAALCVVLAIFAGPWMLAGIPLVIIVDLICCSLMMQHYDRHQVGFLQQVVIQLLILDNELGFLYQCMRHHQYSYANKQLIYFEGQAFGITERGSLLSIAHLVSIAAVGILFLALLG